MDPAAFFCPISIILAFMIASSRLADANSYSITEICGSNPDIKSARTLSAGIMPRWSTFLQFAWNSKAYASIVLSACLQFLYLRYQVFFLAGEANFIKNACWNPPQLPIQPFTSSYHLVAAPTRYPPIIWKHRYSVHIFASAIQLNLFNHSFGSSVSVPPNSPSFTKLPSLNAYPPPIFIPVKAFTKTAIFGSNPPGLIFPPPPGDPPGFPPGFPPEFPPPKPPPNPPPNPGGGFWVLLNPNPWLCGGLNPNPPVFPYKLLKKLNPPVLFPGFPVLLPPWVAPVVVPTGVVVV